METDLIKVLIAEDNPGDVRLISEMLSNGESRFNLESTDNLIRALARISKGGIHVVLLDLGLPDSQGIETFIKLHEVSPFIPVVVLTGLNDANLGIRAVQEGAQDYLVKGQVDGSTLIRSINYAIERQKLIVKLQEAHEKIDTLQGLLPICAACKKIRDKDDKWTHIETYIKERSHADFTHGMCPECAEKYYPQIYGDGKKR